jgi:GNAT superfamily N-acetyltransferase
LHHQRQQQVLFRRNLIQLPASFAVKAITMFTKLPITKLSAYTRYFPGLQLEMVTASILEGNTAAQLWISTAGEALLLWDKGNNVFYFSGEAAAETTIDALAALFATEIRPQAVEEGARYFKVRLLSDGLAFALPTLFRGIDLKESHSLFYSFIGAAPQPAPAPRLDSVDFSLIDGDLLARPGLANMEEVRGEIRWMWPSEEQFLSSGFGYAAHTVDRILCWCTAEYVSRDRCGIGITTDPGFEGRGLATATAARFVAESLRRGIVPHWECVRDNLASVRVAEKVGFTLAEAAHGQVGFFPAE